LVQAASILAASFVRPSHAADALVVVVNSSNHEKPSISELAAIFTTRKQSWSGGRRIVPFNFPPKHSMRVSFDRNLLGMNAEEIARYWVDRRIRGGNAPPKQVSNAHLISRLVGKLDGAIGYLPRKEVHDGLHIVHEL